MYYLYLSLSLRTVLTLINYLFLQRVDLIYNDSPFQIFDNLSCVRMDQELLETEMCHKNMLDLVCTKRRCAARDHILPMVGCDDGGMYYQMFGMAMKWARNRLGWAADQVTPCHCFGNAVDRSLQLFWFCLCTLRHSTSSGLWQIIIYNCFSHHIIINDSQVSVCSNKVAANLEGAKGVNCLLSDSIKIGENIRQDSDWTSSTGKLQHITGCLHILSTSALSMNIKAVYNKNMSHQSCTLVKGPAQLEIDLHDRYANNADEAPHDSYLYSERRDTDVDEYIPALDLLILTLVRIEEEVSTVI